MESEEAPATDTKPEEAPPATLPPTEEAPPAVQSATEPASEEAPPAIEPPEVQQVKSALRSAIESRNVNLLHAAIELAVDTDSFDEGTSKWYPEAVRVEAEVAKKLANDKSDEEASPATEPASEEAPPATDPSSSLSTADAKVSPATEPPIEEAPPAIESASEEAAKAKVEEAAAAKAKYQVEAASFLDQEFAAAVRASRTNVLQK